MNPFHALKGASEAPMRDEKRTKEELVEKKWQMPLKSTQWNRSSLDFNPLHALKGASGAPMRDEKRTKEELVEEN